MIRKWLKIKYHYSQAYARVNSIMASLKQNNKCRVYRAYKFYEHTMSKLKTSPQLNFYLKMYMQILLPYV